MSQEAWEIARVIKLLDEALSQHFLNLAGHFIGGFVLFLFVCICLIFSE